MSNQDRDLLIHSRPFCLLPQHEDVVSAPVGAQSQILGYTDHYSGDPLQACIDSLAKLKAELYAWKPSSGAYPTEIVIWAHFSQQFKTNWFETSDLGQFKVGAFVWVGSQIDNLEACQAMQTEEQEKQALRLLQGWSALISEERMSSLIIY